MRGENELAKRILFIEDDPTICLLIEKMLLKKGWEIVVATSGDMGVEIFRGGSFDLVLTDLHIPKLTGFEVTRRIREMERSGHRTPVPILALSANAEEGIREKCLECGMNELLAKPIRMKDLQNVVEGFLSQKAS
jgi:CheY-like chemotaxis protein